VGPVIAAAESELLSWLRARYPLTVSGHASNRCARLRAGVAETVSGSRPRFDFFTPPRAQRSFCRGGHAEALADEALEVFFAARNRVEFYDRCAAFADSSARALSPVRSQHGTRICSAAASRICSQATLPRARRAQPNPMREIFARLAALAGVEAHQVLHVGDDPEADVVGAIASGNASGVAQPRCAGVAKELAAPRAPFRRSREFLAPMRRSARLAADASTADRKIPVK